MAMVGKVTNELHLQERGFLLRVSIYRKVTIDDILELLVQNPFGI